MTEEQATLVKAADAAKFLNISKRKLWELTQRRMIPHLRIGRAVRYSTASLSSWISENEIQPS